MVKYRRFLTFRECRGSFVPLVVALALVAFGAVDASAQPVFSKSFSPATIGPGSIATLSFTIGNTASAPVTALAFVDTLPAGVTIADPAAALTTCGGTPTAPTGGTVISFSDGSLGAFGSCTVSVNVTSSVIGTHSNVSGDLTSSAGNSGTASADLIVATDRPSFSKSFSPASVPLGSRSTLSFLIDNTNNPSLVFSLSFTDVLPSGMVIASPANVSSTCGGILTAESGASVISLLAGGPMTSGTSCTISVDVVASGIGALGNVTSELSYSTGGPTASAGKAGATLDVVVDTLALTKSFLDDPVPAGAPVNLAFTITNFDRFNTASGISFTDDLDATLSGLVATGTPIANPCGAGSTLSGASVLSLTGGTLAPGATCAFTVPLLVPAAAAAGAYPDTTSTITGSIGGSPVVGAAASDTLFVEPAPSLTKEFVDDPVGAGGTTTLQFTLTNTSATSAATAISFTDELGPYLPTAVSTPAAGFCGAGSSLTFTPLGANPPKITVSGADLAAGASCTFAVTLDVAVGTPNGIYPNLTSAVTGTIDGVTYSGRPATDSLIVVGGPFLNKEFIDDPVLPGNTATLRFTVAHDELAPGSATGISFTDDLDSTLTGLTAVGLPLFDVCGAGSLISGTSSLSLAGGTLAPGTTCSFDVTVQIPAGALPGTYLNTTSAVSATVLGVPVIQSAASDDLLVAGLSLVKEFTDDPVIPGGQVTLRFSLDNQGTSDATNIIFVDSLGAALSGLAATGLPMNDICGTGSQISGTTTLMFTGGSLVAGTSCTFDVVLDVPAAAASGTYGNITSALSADIGGSPVVLPPAIDTLTVEDNLLSLTKSFIDDPVEPGGTVTLRLGVSNLDAAQGATAITFTDDLDAALSGLVAVGLPMNDVCGTGSQISGAGLLTLTGGNLPAGGSCTFDITLQVPVGVPLGTMVTNTTSAATATIGGLGVVGDPASDTLEINFLNLTKAFAGPGFAGETVTLGFTIQNLSATTDITGMSFSDDLDAVLTGLTATGLPVTGVCGAGSVLSGTSFLTLTGGSLAAGSSCSFNVVLDVPPVVAPGSYLNTTSELLQGGLPVGGPATDTLVIEPPPAFGKAFAPSFIGLGGVSTMTLTVDNTGSTVAADALDVTDNLPAGLIVATPPGSSTTCTGGSLTAVAGSGVVSYTGGSVPAGASCVIQVDIVGAAAGSHINTTGDLTSSSGVSGTASATLSVSPQLGFSKAFAPATIATGGVSTMTLTIDNAAAVIDATALDLSDTLPTGTEVATPANASTTCTGGTLTAVAGSGLITYTGGTVAAGASCTVQVDVMGVAAGSYVNIAGPLTSSLGSSGTATATLDVVDVAFTLSKAFNINPVLRGGAIDLEYTLTNTSAVLAVDSIGFTDDLDAVIPGLVASTLPGADPCGVGSQLSGASLLSFSGGSLAPGGSCTFAATLSVPAAAAIGLYPSTTGAVTGQVGGLPVSTVPAFAELEVAFLDFTKAFDASVPPGGAVVLAFTITSPDPVNPVQDLAFTDDLDAVLPGLVAIGLPAADVCGAGSSLDGTSVLSLTGGSLPPGGSCTFNVTLQVPSGAPAGDFLNTTSVLSASVGGSPVTGDPAGVASGMLTILGLAAVPTLGPWGVLMLVGLLALLGAWRLAFRR